MGGVKWAEKPAKAFIFIFKFLSQAQAGGLATVKKKAPLWIDVLHMSMHWLHLVWTTLTWSMWRYPWRPLRKFSVCRSLLQDSLLYHLHWLPACFWVQFKVLVLTFNALNSLRWSYRAQYFLSPEIIWQNLLAPLAEIYLVVSQERTFSAVKPKLEMPCPRMWGRCQRYCNFDLDKHFSTLLSLWYVTVSAAVYVALIFLIAPVFFNRVFWLYYTYSAKSFLEHFLVARGKYRI